jgi:hypothetical protein
VSEPVVTAVLHAHEFVVLAKALAIIVVAVGGGIFLGAIVPSWIVPQAEKEQSLRYQIKKQEEDSAEAVKRLEKELRALEDSGAR